MTEADLLASGAEPRVLLVAAWLMPLSVIPLMLSSGQPFLRAHALAGTATGGLAVAVLTLGNLLPVWLALPFALPVALWLGVHCLRGMLAALAGRPPPESRWLSAWMARLERP